MKANKYHSSWTAKPIVTNAQRISTTVNYAQWRLVQENQWKWSELISLGIGAKMKPDALLAKLDAMQFTIDEMKRAEREREVRANTKRFMSMR